MTVSKPGLADSLDSIQDREFLEQMNDHKPLKTLLLGVG
jgi:hypothetical protein